MDAVPVPVWVRVGVCVGVCVAVSVDVAVSVEDELGIDVVVATEE